MKKVFAAILVACLCLGLCACGKCAEAMEADALITAIGTVTLDSENAIVNAETYYEALTEEQKEDVENLTILTEARTTLESLKLQDLYETAKATETADPRAAVELYNQLPADYEDVESRLSALTVGYTVSAVSTCKIAQTINGETVLNDTCLVRAMPGDDVVVTVAPECTYCKHVEAPLTVTVPLSDFDKQEVVEIMNATTCSNESCSVSMYLYMATVTKAG